MSGGADGAAGRISICLSDGWEFKSLPRDVPADPRVVGRSADGWLPARVPGTVASALRDAGRWRLDGPERDFDDEDWWYRLRFAAAPAAGNERRVLRFEGLATCAELWLNEAALADAESMFLACDCDVSDRLREQNLLLIRFRSVRGEIGKRRGRPRWRTPMVAHPQLRWVRTSLLGRTPGWSPPAAPVGPWRPVRLVHLADVELVEPRLHAEALEGAGVVRLDAEIRPLGDAVVTGARLIVRRGDVEWACDLAAAAGTNGWSGRVSVPDAARWWPHTHGEPARYAVQLRVQYRRGGPSGATTRDFDLGGVGFRRVAITQHGGGFALEVNGREIFCRGVCWTPLDPVGLQGTVEEHRAALESIAAAGMNMVRICGPLVYESEEFLALCDSLGILVWQDLMFCNMDYPTDDAAFRALCEREVREVLARLRAHPCVAVVCGNSEVEQQAAMSGADPGRWRPEFFHRTVPALLAALCPDLPYWPSSAHGGAFPHQNDAGTCSYYGVGAYRQPLTDARRSDLRFATECLAFANVPEAETVAEIAGEPALRCHDPRWKRRVPRDLGAGWDFEDVRDHYLACVFGEDPLALRHDDHDRYLELSRVVGGEVMAACFAEWRRARSACGGALVWFYRDLWPGAGWGIVDSTGLPKAPYYHLKRVLQPRAVAIADEGTNGLVAHVWNDSPAPLAARLDVDLYRHSHRVGRRESLPLEIEAHGARAIALTTLFGAFVDLSYVYRFGPPMYDVLCARLVRPADEATLAEAFHFPLGLPRTSGADLGMAARGWREDADTRVVRIETREFARSVRIDVPGFVADDQYFHMAPNSTRQVRLRARRERAGAADVEGAVRALNGGGVARIPWEA